MKASFKIVKRLFCLGYTSKKYHRSVRNVAMVLVAAVALGSSTYAWFVSNNTVASDGTMVANTLKIVEANADSATKGSPADAVTAQYAVKNTFFIGSKGTELSDLVVTAAYQLVELVGIEAERFHFLLESDKLTENEKNRYRALIDLRDGHYTMDRGIVIQYE